MLSPLPEIQPGGDEAQRQRRRPDERNFVRPAMQQLRGEFARAVQASGINESFLVAGGAARRIIGNRLRHPVRQRTDAGVREEDFSARHREFAPANFLVGKNFGQCHAMKLIGGTGPAKRIKIALTIKTAVADGWPPHWKLLAEVIHRIVIRMTL